MEETRPLDHILCDSGNFGDSHHNLEISGDVPVPKYIAENFEV
jgi:hypothetical protein